MSAEGEKPASGLRPYPSGPARAPRPGRPGVARWVVLAMAVLTLVCPAAGYLRGGQGWLAPVAGGALLLVGTACVAVGLLELEWLERLFNLVDSVYTAVTGGFWKPWTDSLADSPVVSRKWAAVIWTIAGLALFACGCLVSTGAWGWVLWP